MVSHQNENQSIMGDRAKLRVLISSPTSENQSNLFNALYTEITQAKKLKLAVNAVTRSQLGGLPIDEAATLGILIREQRTTLAVSQAELAKAAGVGRRLISDLENGKPTIELKKVLVVCYVLGIDLVAQARRSTSSLRSH